jgi:hypothetical protein
VNVPKGTGASVISSARGNSHRQKRSFCESRRAKLSWKQPKMGLQWDDERIASEGM